LLEAAADTHVDRPALVYRGLPLTFERVREQMNRVASSLQQALAVDPGHRIALHLPNCPQFLIVAHAAWKLGAAVVPVDPAADAAQIAQQTITTEARVIVTLSPQAPTVLAACGQPQTPLRHVIVASVKDYLPFGAKLRYTLFREKKEGQAFDRRAAPRFVYPYPNMVLHNPRPDPVDVGPDDPALLLPDRTLTHRDLLSAIGPVETAVEPRTITVSAPFWRLDGLAAALAGLYGGNTLLLDTPSAGTIRRTPLMPGVQSSVAR
jgi:long-chain acyl-CoA synthetase